GGTADALASGASWSNPVGVQIPASAPSISAPEARRLKHDVEPRAASDDEKRRSVAAEPATAVDHPHGDVPASEFRKWSGKLRTLWRERPLAAVRRVRANIRSF